MANCFWDDYEGHRKLYLANWHLVCMKKEYRGLGIPNLKDLNLCFLGSWVKRFISDEVKLWRGVVDRKYCRANSIFYADKAHASPFWKGIILAAQAIKFGYRWVVGNGQKIHFWEGTWFGIDPLAVQFWELYSVCNEKTKCVADIWVEGELRLSFQRTFTDRMMQSWGELQSIAESLVLSNETDALV
jgi:hypothetical protein